MDRQARILVVDDDDLVLESLKSELGQRYHVITAQRGSEALSLFRREDIDCVISDVRMPGMNGLDVLKEVSERDPHVGRILITAYTDSSAKDIALRESGIFKIAKPWRDELEIAVRRALELRDKSLQLAASRRKFEKGLAMDRQMRRMSKPIEILQAALDSLAALDCVQVAELVINGKNGQRRALMATPEQILVQQDVEIPQKLVVCRFDPKIARKQHHWEYQVSLWETEGERWSLRCFLSKLREQEVSWIDFVADKMIDAMDRNLLTKEVNLRRLVAESSVGQLCTLEKMSALGMLAAGIVHEINSPSSYVRANLQGLMESMQGLDELVKQAGREIEDGDLEIISRAWGLIRGSEAFSLWNDDVFSMLQDAGDGIERIIGIAKNLRSFAHSGQDKRRPFRVEPCLDASLAIVMYRYKTGIQLIRSYAEVPEVLGYSSEVSQVLLNLLLNAIQAMGGEGVLEATTSFDGNWVKVDVADSGPGIPQKLRQKVFEPLYTTKAVGEGTGLGLSISKDLVEKQGGRISVSSNDRGGATFSVLLPAVT